MAQKKKAELLKLNAERVHVRDAAFDEAVATARLVAAIRAAGKADKRTKAAFVIGRVMRAHLKVKGMREYLAAGDNARATIHNKLAREVTAIYNRKGWADPAKAGEHAATIRKEIAGGVRRTKEDHDMIRAAERAWSRFCKEHGLTQVSKKAGNMNAGKKNGADARDVTTTKALADQIKAEQAPGIEAARNGAVPATKRVPVIASTEDVTRFMQLKAEDFRVVLDGGAKHITHVQRQIMRDYIAAVKALTEPEA